MWSSQHGLWSLSEKERDKKQGLECRYGIKYSLIHLFIHSAEGLLCARHHAEFEPPDPVSLPTTSSHPESR